jgi:glycosyltransferase involved in cell wall biosynthesis
MAYAFIGYPLLIFVLSRLYKSRIEGKAFLPNVSVVLVVFNEAAKIKQRIENLLSSDYPNQALELVIVRDGSDDDTEAIVSALNHRQIKILTQGKRSGKPAGINAAIEHCSGEIVVFCDARQTFTSDTIRRLVSHFSDDKIGAVSGALEINKSSSSVGSGVDLYWRLKKY